MTVYSVIYYIDISQISDSAYVKTVMFKSEGKC